MKIGNSKYELNHIYNEDCLQAMKQIPDKSIDFEFIRYCKARNNAGLKICQSKKKNLAKGLKTA